MKKLILMSLFLASCVPAHGVWAPGPSAVEDVTRVTGKCKLMAMGATGSPGYSSFYVHGSPSFVGAYTGATALAGIIATGVQNQSAFEACMEANGFVPVTPTPPAVAAR